MLGLFTLIIISSLFTPSQQKVITVDSSNGNDTLCNQTNSHPCKTLHILWSVLWSVLQVLWFSNIVAAHSSYTPPVSVCGSMGWLGIALGGSNYLQLLVYIIINFCSIK